MKLTIRRKLVLLGFLSVGALITSSYLSYSGGEKVRALNDQSRYIQSNRDMSIRMVKQYNTFAMHYYQALADRTKGAVAKEHSDAITENISAMHDMIERFIDRKTKYPDDKLKDGMAIIDELTPLMQKELPQLAASHASEQDFEALNKKIESKLPILGEIANDADASVREQLLDIAAEVNDDILFANKEVLIILGAALVLLLPMVLMIILSIARPLKRVVGDIERLASGDFSQELGGKNRKDEIGDVVKALNALQEYTAQKAKAEAEQEMKRKEIADAEKRQTMNAMADKFESSVKGIVSTVAAAATQLAQTAEGLVRTMSETSQTAQNAAEGATQTVANVQSVASAAEEMTASVKEISSQLQNSNSMVQDSVNKAESANVQAGELNNATTKVKDVIELISNISGQINLLALNATIESARAGDAGKGFAVVASEVKNLASQTDKSVQEIEKVIGEMNLASDGIISSLKGITESIQNISGASSTIAAAVEEQSATTNEIAKNMQSAAQATETISGNLTEVTKSSSFAESSSSQVLEASQELSRQAEQLNTEVESFLHTIRTS